MDYFVCENPECLRMVYTDSAERLHFRCPACASLLRGVLLRDGLPPALTRGIDSVQPIEASTVF